MRHKILYTLCLWVGLCTAAVSQEEPEPLYTQTREERVNATIWADDFGEKPNNIGIALYYRPGNKGSPDQYGEHMAKKIEDRARERGYEFNARHFTILDLEGTEGIGVEFFMGPLGIDDIDYLAALNDLDRIIDRKLEAIDLTKKLNRTSERVLGEN